MLATVIYAIWQCFATECVQPDIIPDNIAAEGPRQYCIEHAAWANANAPENPDRVWVCMKAVRENPWVPITPEMPIKPKYTQPQPPHLVSGLPPAKSPRF